MSERKYHGIDAEELLSEMAEAYTDAFDLDVSTETMLRAALRVLSDATEFKPAYILEGLLRNMSRTKRERDRMAELWVHNTKATETNDAE